jgi:hypothetical protein
LVACRWSIVSRVPDVNAAAPAGVRVRYQRVELNDVVDRPLAHDDRVRSVAKNQIVLERRGLAPQQVDAVMDVVLHDVVGNEQTCTRIVRPRRVDLQTRATRTPVQVPVVGERVPGNRHVLGAVADVAAMLPVVMDEVVQDVGTAARAGNKDSRAAILS